MIGSPRRHLRVTESTNAVARELAAAGAPHGTLVTADEQQAGRGRQGRTWSAPPSTSLLLSVVLRDAPAPLPLRAAVAVSEVVGERAQIKWPNDVQVDGRKVCGILAEGRPAEGWAVLGIGLNVALRVEDLPPELHATAGTLGLTADDLEPVLGELLHALGETLQAPGPELLGRYRERDALTGQLVRWDTGTGTATGVDAEGRLLVETAAGVEALDAGEVHLLSPATPGGS